MAEEIGLLLLGHGYAVTWISHTAARAAAFESRMVRLVRRAARVNPGIEEGVQGFLGMDALNGVGAIIEKTDLVIETTVESEEAKREVLEQLVARIGLEVPVFSNASSILPTTLHPRCIGVHFFRPIVLTGFVEVVFPAAVSEARRQQARLILQGLGLCWIEQADPGVSAADLPNNRAFAANRLLLPVQAECLRLLMAGHAPVVVNQASGSALFPVGQLALMDAIGLDVVAAGSGRYLSRMADDLAQDLLSLTIGLNQLLAMGKLGNKNGDGLLRGTPLPWTDAPPQSGPPLTEWLSALTLNACALALDAGMLTLPELDLILDRVFQAQGTFGKAAPEASRRGWPELLAQGYQETGIWYYRPVLAQYENLVFANSPDHVFAS